MKGTRADSLIMIGRDHIFNESVFINSIETDYEVTQKLYDFLRSNVSGSIFRRLQKKFIYKAKNKFMDGE